MSTRFFSFLAGVMALAGAQAMTVYVDPAAPADGDGTTWATAYQTMQLALTAAENDTEATERVICLAEGVYKLTATGVRFEFYKSGYRILGGYHVVRGEGEVTVTRDPALYETIFSGDIGGDDYWKHVSPAYGTFARTETELPDEKIIVDGKINWQAYTGADDTYVRVAAGYRNNCTERCFRFNSGSDAFVEGCIFTAFQSNYAIDLNGCKDVTITNCLFVANEHVVFDNTANGQTTVVGCRFLHNSGACSYSSGKSEVSHCLFEGNSSSGISQRGSCFTFQNNSTHNVHDCVLARNLDFNPAKPNANVVPASLVYCWDGQPTLRRMVVTNNYLCTKIGATMFSMRYSFEFTDSVVADNLMEALVTTNQGYVMFGPFVSTSNQRDRLFANTVFAGNEIKAVTTAIDDGTRFGLGIVGHGATFGFFSFVNDTFDANKATTDSVNDSGAVLSRGVLSTSVSSLSQPPQVGVANCTFVGPAADGVYDIAQFGNQNSYPLRVINSVFMTDGAVAQPIYTDDPNHIEVTDCTIKNFLPQFQPTEYSVATGLETDAVPLEKVPQLGTAYGSYRPTVRMPRIRTTLDIATNNPAFPHTVQFLQTSGSWLPLVQSSVYTKPTVNATKDPFCDALGEVRPLTAMTRGAVQQMTAAAEDEAAHVLICRADPVLYGTFLGAGNVQMVVSGVQSVPVVAEATVEGVAFEGWFDENGTRLDYPATLPALELEADTVLTARFTTPKVALTFDLGAAGTFDETGTSTYVTNLSAGAAFPTVPSYTEAADWHVGEWTPALPSLVPVSATTYAAKALPAASGICVVPEGEGAGRTDGEGWANAAEDFEAAYAKAERYRLALWMKTGVYTFRTAAPLRNAAILGGFAGTETSADEADPERHPTVITGDLTQNNYWKPNGEASADGEKVSCYDYANLRANPPNPEGADSYWQASADVNDTPFGFVYEAGAKLGPVLIRGVTMTGFNKSAISVGNSLVESLTLERCLFTANNHQGGSDTWPAILVGGAPLILKNSTFYGSYYTFNLPAVGTTVVTNVAENCLFDGNNAMLFRAFMPMFITNCVFRRNYGSRGEGPCLYISYGGNGRSTIVDTTFEDNLTVAGGSCGPLQLLGRHAAEITRCRFTGNRFECGSFSGSKHSAAFTMHESTATIRDCYFGRNTLAVPNVTSGTASSAFSSEGGTATFVNCTFDGNEAIAGSGAHVGTFAATGNQAVTLVNCLVIGSTLTGGTASEFAFTSGANPLSLFNTVLANDASGYVPFDLYSKIILGLATCAIDGYDPSVLPTTADSFYYDVIDSAGDDFLPARTVNGVTACGVSGGAPYARKGRLVAWGSNGIAYVYVGDKEPGTPWKRGNTTGKDARVWPADMAKLGLDDPQLIPDAFGAARGPKRVTLGPLETHLGLMLLVR